MRVKFYGGENKKKRHHNISLMCCRSTSRGHSWTKLVQLLLFIYKAVTSRNINVLLEIIIMLMDATWLFDLLYFDSKSHNCCFWAKTPIQDDSLGTYDER